MFVSEVEGTRTEDHRALRRRVRLSFDLSVCVGAMVVLVFELCWRYAVEVVEEAAVVGPVDPVCWSARYRSAQLRSPPGRRCRRRRITWN